MAGEDQTTGESTRTNFGRLDRHLPDSGLAKRLLVAYRDALAKDKDPATSLRMVINDRLAELKGPDARSQDQQD